MDNQFIIHSDAKLGFCKRLCISQLLPSKLYKLNIKGISISTLMNLYLKEVK